MNANTRIFTFLFVALFIGLLTSCQTQKAGVSKSDFPELLVRKDTASTSAEWRDIQARYDKYTAAIIKDSNDNKARLKLAEVYVNEARVTGNLAHYNDAALQMVNQVIKKKGVAKDDLYTAMTYKASLLLSLHQFEAARDIAMENKLINEHDASNYGALVDANVEMGNYEEAVKMCDKMMTIRPDLRSYSRVSYMRQINGDNAGAIAAMKLAVLASPMGMEATEWANVTLGDLYLNVGKLDTAKLIYETSLKYRPKYAYAEMGLAKVARAEKKYDVAIEHCKNAIRSLSESSFVSFLADLYELKGDKAKAKEVREDVLALVIEGEKENEKATYAKHNGNREVAMAYMNAGKLDNALVYAQKDWNIRPKNIDANELLAWIYYLKKDYPNAKKHADAMLATHTKNATTLYKASMIYLASGDTSKGNELKTMALNVSPHIDPLVLNPTI